VNPLWLELAAGVARWAMTFVGAALIERHILSPSQTEELSKTVVRDAVLWAPVIASLVWNLWSKYKSRVKFLTALEQPSGTTEHQVTQVIKDGCGASVRT
jgi:hypothetical protein